MFLVGFEVQDFLVNRKHAFDVSPKIAFQGCVDRRVIDGDHSGNIVGTAEGDGHADFCAPAVSKLNLSVSE